MEIGLKKPLSQNEFSMLGIRSSWQYRAGGGFRRRISSVARHTLPSDTAPVMLAEPHPQRPPGPVGGSGPPGVSSGDPALGTPPPLPSGQPHRRRTPGDAAVEHEPETSVGPVRSNDLGLWEGQRQGPSICRDGDSGGWWSPDKVHPKKMTVTSLQGFVANLASKKILVSTSVSH